MGLLEKAEKILQENDKNQLDNKTPDSKELGGLYKRCIAYIGENDKKKTVGSLHLTTDTIHISNIEPEDVPFLVRSFVCFESFTSKCNCERSLIVTLDNIKKSDKDTTPRIVFCKGFDFTTEHRFMLPYEALLKIVDEDPFCALTTPESLEMCKGYISSTEYRALECLYIVKLPQVSAWFIIAKSKLNEIAPNLLQVKTQILDFTYQLAKYKLPIAPFVPAAVFNNNENHIQSLIKAALIQKKKCLLLKLSVASFFSDCLHYLPSHYEHSVFLEIVAHMKRATSSENILNAISSDNIRVGIFSNEMTDANLYVLQLNKSFAQTSGENSAFQLVNFTVLSDMAAIFHFMTQE